ncbi:MAG: hypothetical protein AAFO77_01520 [Pseudomonadota bacterium]
MTQAQTFALKAATVLWIIWGAVHAFAGIMVLLTDAQGAAQLIADAVDPAELVNDYHPAVTGILHQHGWNLLWVGVATTIGAFFIWGANMTSIWVTGMLGGLFDIGYFVFLDVGGFSGFVPGTIMTFVSATAIILSFWVWLTNRSEAVTV